MQSILSQPTMKMEQRTKKEKLTPSKSIQKTKPKLITNITVKRK